MSYVFKTNVPLPILTLAELRELERRCHDLRPSLMERAGAAAAGLALQLLAESAHPERQPLLVAGPGNNGGDAFVAARVLLEHGLHPVVVFAGRADQLSADALAAYQAWVEAYRAVGGAGCVVHEAIPANSDRKWGLVIDGLFGTGLARALEGRYALLVEQINNMDCPRLSLDVPSGLDSETGRVLGCAVQATHTLSFLGLKVGLLTLDGPDHAGAVSMHDLEVVLEPSTGRTVQRALFAEQLQPRLRNSHKGSHGSVGILGGASGMAGAALLAGRAALRLGAGRVYVGMLERLPVDVQQPELMLRPAEEVIALARTASAPAIPTADGDGEPATQDLPGTARYALAVGPGLGLSATAYDLLQQAVAINTPLLLDADALNLLALHPVLGKAVRRRRTSTLLTPHPAEAARLLDCSVAWVQADRLRAARALAEQFGAVVVLKGCGSIIALPNGRWFMNTTGNSGLASAGTGDVLSGIAVALLAQGWPAEQALLAAVHLHGAVADDCVAAAMGPIGLTATELIDAGRQVLNRWMASIGASRGLR